MGEPTIRHSAARSTPDEGWFLPSTGVTSVNLHLLGQDPKSMLRKPEGNANCLVEVHGYGFQDAVG